VWRGLFIIFLPDDREGVDIAPDGRCITAGAEKTGIYTLKINRVMFSASRNSQEIVFVLYTPFTYGIE
jgi:hypothetical protein